MTLKFTAQGNKLSVDFAGSAKQSGSLDFEFADNMEQHRCEFITRWQNASIEEKLTPNMVKEFYQNNLKLTLLMYVQQKSLMSESSWGSYLSNPHQTFDKISLIHARLKFADQHIDELDYFCLFNFVSSLVKECEKLDMNSRSTYWKSYLFSNPSELSGLLSGLKEVLGEVTSGIHEAMVQQNTPVFTVSSSEKRQTWNLLAADAKHGPFSFNWVNVTGQPVLVSDVAVPLSFEEGQSKKLVNLSQQDDWYRQLADYELAFRNELRGLSQNTSGELTSERYFSLCLMVDFMNAFNRAVENAPTYSNAVVGKEKASKVNKLVRSDASQLRDGFCQSMKKLLRSLDNRNQFMKNRFGSTGLSPELSSGLKQLLCRQDKVVVSAAVANA